jgi:hypothetical protein
MSPPISLLQKNHSIYVPLPNTAAKYGGRQIIALEFPSAIKLLAGFPQNGFYRTAPKILSRIPDLVYNVIVK